MKLHVQNLLLLVLMLISASLGAVLRPAISLADERVKIDLAAMVPKDFGEWREDPNLVAQIVNPQKKSLIDKIYSQTLDRTYISLQGYRIMLSIAYGKNQSDALQLHKPDICYPAQGFVVISKKIGVLHFLDKSIEITRLETSLGDRYEPVTYWTLVGEHIVTTGIGKKLIELHYALHNRIPDGMLVRISSIDRDTETAYSIHEKFSNDMVNSINGQFRIRYSGASEK